VYEFDETTCVSTKSLEQKYCLQPPSEIVAKIFGVSISLEHFDPSVSQMQFMPDHKLVASYNTGQVTIFNLQNNSSKFIILHPKKYYLHAFKTLSIFSVLNSHATIITPQKKISCFNNFDISSISELFDMVSQNIY
jgi:hypothetical protein